MSDESADSEGNGERKSRLDEFQAIPHCGGRLEFKFRERDGHVQYSMGFHSKGRNAVALAGIYAYVPMAKAVCMIRMGGIGSPWSEAPVEPCIPILVGSDNEGMFGAECPHCGQYFRSDCALSVEGTICPYCRHHAQGHQFLTTAHEKFVLVCVNRFEEALDKVEDFTLDFDQVADEVASGQGADQTHVYSEQRQQTQFICTKCGARHDIFGQFGFCCCCGVRNSLSLLERSLGSIEEQVGNPRFSESQRQEREREWRELTRDTVSHFDAYCRDLIEFLSKLPATQSRQRAIISLNPHRPIEMAESMKLWLDIDILRGLSEGDLEFVKIRFLRRHIYEHRAGQADEEYIQASGENLRVNQLVRERSANVRTIVHLVRVMATNLHDGFHSIVRPVEARFSQTPAVNS